MKTGIIVGFGTIAQLILSNAVRGYQVQSFMELLCNGISAEGDFQWDAANFSRMVHGKRQIFPMVSEHYKSESGLKELTSAVEDSLLTEIADVPRLIRELEAAVRCDGTISVAKREELLSGTDAEIIAKILQFAMIRPEQNVKQQSPKVEKLFCTAAIPKSDKRFVGRRDELAGMEERLKADNLLFITGVPGIGKRSLAKQFAHINRKRYTNQLYMRFNHSARDTITDLWHVEDRLDEAAEDRFQRHFRLLSCLEEDSLLLIVGMDCLPEEDESFELLRQLNCHVIITTELEMQQENRLFLDRFNNLEELLQLFESYCPKRMLKGATEVDVLMLLALVGWHTYAVQLLALTVKNGFETVSELTDMIQAQGIASMEEFPVEVKRDGQYQYDSVKSILTSVIQIQNLGEREQKVLGNFTLMPLKGVKKARFGKWTGQRMAVQLLIRSGWIQEENGILFMSALVRDVISEIVRPDVESCEYMMNQMVKESKVCTGEKALELLQCIESACGQVWNKDNQFVAYLAQFGAFFGRYNCDLIKNLITQIPEQEKSTTAGRIKIVFLEAIDLLGEAVARKLKKGELIGSLDYHRKNELLFEEIKLLASEADEKTQQLLWISCDILATLSMMEKKIDLMIALVSLKNKIIGIYGISVPHDYDTDILLLYGLLVLLYENQEYKSVFLDLVEQKRQESVRIGDSQKYRKRLEILKEYGERIESYENDWCYYSSVFRLFEGVPWIAGLLRRIKR